MSSSTISISAPVEKLDILDIKEDEEEVLQVYRRAKRMGYADIAITIQEGERVKLWLTEKIK